MSSFNNKHNILVQNIKTSNCLKSKIDAGNMLYSIVNKRLSFVVPNIDNQNIAFKTFCYHADLLSDAENFEEGILNYRENLLNKTLTNIEITELTEQFYIIVKIAINPFIRTIQNFISHTSHNLTFREYIKSFNDENIRQLISKEDFLMGDLQYVVDEEFLITGTIKVPEQPKIIIKHEEDTRHSVNIDITNFYKNNNENEDSTDKFMADTPLNEIDTKKINIYKTEFFYDNEIKKIIMDYYLIDFNKYQFSTSINLYNPYNEYDSNYDDTYLQEIKNKFGSDAEFVLKEEQRNNNNICKLKLEQEILKGQINTYKEQINYKENVKERILNEKTKINKTIMELSDEIKRHQNIIDKFNNDEPKLWNNCDSLIQKRLKEETLYKENSKEFTVVEQKYFELVNLENNSKNVVDKIQETINTFLVSKNELEDFEKDVQNTIKLTKIQLKESSEELVFLNEEISNITERCHMRSELMRETGIEHDKTSNLISELRYNEEELKTQKQQLLDSLETVEEKIKNTQKESKKLSTILSTLSNTMSEEGPLLETDSIKLEKLINQREEKNQDIISEQNTEVSATNKLKEIESEKIEIESKIRKLSENKSIELLNKRQKSLKKETFEKEYNLKKKIHENHKKKFEATQSVEEFAINKTKKASLEKLDSEKIIKELNKKIASSTENANKLSQSENKIEIQLIEKSTSIENIEEEIAQKESDIQKIKKSHDTINQKVQHYRQQLIKQVHIHTIKDKGSIANNVSVNNILLDIVKRRNLDAVVDVGAKTGEFSKLFTTCPSVKNIDLIEPNYGMYCLLTSLPHDNYISTNLQPWNVHNFAIMSEQVKSLTYYYNGLENSIGSFNKSKVLGNTESIRTKQIPTKKLDDINFPGNKYLLKIDCGNKNIQVIQTMSKLLESKKVDVMCILCKDKTDPYNDFMLNFIKMYFKKYKSVMMPKYCMIFEEPK